MLGNKMTPDQAAHQFYAALIESKCPVSWAVFSGESQKHFAQWALDDIYARTGETAKAAGIGLKEVRLMFERNDPSIMKFFWKRFFFASGANDIARFGQFETDSIKENRAVVKVTLRYPNQQTREIGLPMVKERGNWKLAYVENKLPF